MQKWLQFNYIFRDCHCRLNAEQSRECMNLRRRIYNNPCPHLAGKAIYQFHTLIPERNIPHFVHNILLNRFLGIKRFSFWIIFQLNFIPKVPIATNSACVYISVRHQTGDKPWCEQMMVLFTDACIHQQDLVALKHAWLMRNTWHRILTGVFTCLLALRRLILPGSRLFQNHILANNRETLKALN